MDARQYGGSPRAFGSAVLTLTTAAASPQEIPGAVRAVVDGARRDGPRRFLTRPGQSPALMVNSWARAVPPLQALQYCSQRR